MKKIRMIKCLALALIFTFSSIAPFTVSSAAFDNQTSYEANVIASNDKVFNFWDCYTDYDTAVYSPPDYFGGFNLNDDGSLTVYVAEDSPSIRAAIADVCGSDDIQFEEVSHSFNELKAAMENIDNYSIDNIKNMSLDLKNNEVAVYVDSQDSTAQNSLNSLISDKSVNSDMISIREYEEPLVQGNLDIAAETPVENNEVVANSYALFYPGQVTSFGDSQSGTIGFCAVDSNGRSILITHSHGYGFSGSQDAKSVTVGGISMSAYSLSPNPTSAEDQSYDAAYIVIPSSVSATLTNKVANSSGNRISYIAYDSQLLSYSGSTMRAYGNTSGFIEGTASISFNYGVYNLSFDVTPAPGDSGGPIYLTGSSQNRLLGIMQLQYGAGTLWKNIRDRYHTLTGKTLTPYIRNT